MPANLKPIFQEIFHNYQDYYVLIGGTATSIVLDAKGFESRTTKDYDMVIIDELKNKDFYNTLTKFLELGEYAGSQKDNKAQLFRFTTKKAGFPEMVELFSILPEYPLKKLGRETPVHFDEDASLSALLLDEEYYQLLVKEREVIDGYSVLSNRGLIVFKAKAWLDMTDRVTNGAQGLSKKIKKHLNDVTRLAALLHEGECLSDLEVSDTVKQDMVRFVDLLALKIESIPQNSDIMLTKDEVFDILRDFLTR
ncbi:hypothetical protein HMPREF1512_1738 [Streptococcus sp. OBRC6]|nr:hypothetical protein HMPREF1512_1738 [Streptococcus sp. OBRC6]